MRNLQRTLQEDTDAALLPTLAKVWKTTITGLDVAGSIPVITAAMLDAVKAETVWDALSDEQRGAMQMLTGSGGRCRKEFTRVFGDIRKMARRKSSENRREPDRHCRRLYYRGLIAEAFSRRIPGHWWCVCAG
jgi:hypothetical protein